jgi:hypothetical protein
MRSAPLLLVLLVLLNLAAAAPDGKPAPSNVPRREFPKIHADRSVSFRIKAPDARLVQLMPRGDDNGMGKGPFDFRKDEGGNWTLTTGPVRAGFHYYELVVDGAGERSELRDVLRVGAADERAGGAGPVARLL